MSINTPSAAPEDLLARIERMEATDSIRQLASRYALSVDMRDFDALVTLYTEDTRVGKHERGRAALKQMFSKVLGQFDATSHQIGNHIIDFDGPDHADGVVYCYCQHEIGDKLAVMQMLYVDRYKRVEGRWYFERRLPCLWYVADSRESPTGPQKVRWPGLEPSDGTFHSVFPSFAAFANDPDSGSKPLRPIDPERFIASLRQGQPLPGFTSLQNRPSQS